MSYAFLLLLALIPGPRDDLFYLEDTVDYVEFNVVTGKAPKGQIIFWDYDKQLDDYVIIDYFWVWNGNKWILDLDEIQVNKRQDCIIFFDYTHQVYRKIHVRGLIKDTVTSYDPQYHEIELRRKEHQKNLPIEKLPGGPKYYYMRKGFRQPHPAIREIHQDRKFQDYLKQEKERELLKERIN